MIVSRRYLIPALLMATLTVWTAPPAASAAEPELSHTRLLRRNSLKLLGRSPTMAEYQALLDAPDAGAKEQIIQTALDNAMNSPEFNERLVEFGYDYLDVGQFASNWSLAAHLTPCADGTIHAGKLGTFRPYEKYSSYGASTYICDEHGGPCDGSAPCPGGFTCDTGAGLCQPNSCTKDADCGRAFVCDTAKAKCTVLLATVAPWWAPQTTIETIGWAGQGHTTAPDGNDPQNKTQDCGVIRIHSMNKESVIHDGDHTIKPKCGCGPNLIYCARRSYNYNEGAATGLSHDGFKNDPTGLLTSLFQESARLFAHIIMQDRPFTDLVLGDYTVVNQGLQHFYVRSARQIGQYQELDNSTWWQQIADPNEWREVVVETMYPYYLQDRNTKFDPREDYGEPPGIPSAGVMTTVGSLSSFMRERPRAARWLENLTCRQYNPPAAGINFPPFETDPGTQGVCLHCHQTIDPAAIHFKRMATAGHGLGGLTPYRWDQIAGYGSPLSNDKKRWNSQFAPDTLMTPITQLDLDMNPDARFIDFAPPGITLFDITSDGTIGPLGFAKMIVESGEFDRCTVRRFYERFGGFRLNPAAHKLFIDKMVQVFTDGGKKIRPFIKWILSQPRARLGH